jgi:uncharacterized protein YacL
MNQVNPAVKYGMIGAIILVILGIVMQMIILNSMKSAAENPVQFSPMKILGFSLLSLLLIGGVYIFCIIKSMKDYRKFYSEYTYNNLVKQGLLATLIIAVVSSFFSYLYGYVLASESREQIIELTKRIYEGIDMSNDQRDKAISQLENANPIRQAITGLGITLLLGLITSLISASVLKRKYDINNPNLMR